MVDLNDLAFYLTEKLGGSRDSIPVMRFVNPAVMPLNQQVVPFKLLHILDVLFSAIDTEGFGIITAEEFVAFCRKTGLFNKADEDPLTVFLQSRSAPKSEDLFGSASDPFGGIDDHDYDPSIVQFTDFERLMIDAGIVERIVRETHTGTDPTLVSYFIEERVVDLITPQWFAIYNANGDGMHFEDFLRLCDDYRLPFPKTTEAFNQLDLDGNGFLDIDEFLELLMGAKVLQTGASVGIDDAVGHVWREIEESQVFQPQQRVLVADGREGCSPPQAPNTLRFVCISDTHGQHELLTGRMPPGDVLLHGGDFTMAGEYEEVKDFARWLRSLPYSQKVVIAGNHDLSFDAEYEGQHSKRDTDSAGIRRAFHEVCEADSGVTYLEDSECTIQGVRIYGTPWQPEFGYWAFNLPRGEPLAEKWRKVPEGVDILIVHGPPLGRGDACLPSWKRLGCADLLAQVQGRIKPKFVVSGHIHEGAGVTFDGVTHFLNASTLNEHYEGTHAPMVFDIPIG